MNVLEKEIEDIVWEAEWSELKKRGLYIYGFGIRQLNLGSYGIADIVTFDLEKTKYKSENRIYDTSRKLIVGIYELKKDEININTFLQALKYAKAIQRMCKEQFEFSITLEISINLIGKSIEMDSTFCYLVDVCENINLYTYSIDLYQGIKFQRRTGFYLKNESLISLSEDQLKGILGTTETYVERT